MKIIKKALKYITLTFIAIIISVSIWLLISNTNFTDTPRASTQYWELKTGSRIAYTHIKSKKDTIKSTILYLHGGPGGYISDLDINVFEEISEEGYEVYLYDQIGCGLSERLDKPREYTALRHFNDLDEIVKSIKSNNITLVGQSWGGFLASYYAAYHPSINQLILTSPGGIKPTDSLLSEKYEPNLIKGLTNIDDRINRINARIESDMTIKEKIWLAIGSKTGNSTIVSNNKMDGVLHNVSKIFVSGMVCDTINTPSSTTGRPGMYCSIFTNKSYKDVPSELRNKMKLFSNPVLILKAECDYLPWQDTYEYKDLFPKAKLKVVKNAGHSILIENRTDYIYEILHFLEEKK